MNTDVITLAHGGGGREMRELISQLLVPLFDSPELQRQEDQAILDWSLQPGEQLAFSTDSFVVSPLFFPGGDIGSLAVHGTVNDLAMGGARPRVLSCSLIIEEGLPISTLKAVCQSMARSAQEAKVSIVTGDTKVVRKGQADQLYINTSGIGVTRAGYPLGSAQIRAGDSLLVSGPIGEHGAAVLCSREQLDFDTPIRSDSQSLAHLVSQMLDQVPGIKALRDLTRGGLAAVLHEYAHSSRLSMQINQADIPVSPPVYALCELLGFSPLQLACEGRLLAVVDSRFAQKLLQVMQQHPAGRSSAVIGQVTSDGEAQVMQHSALGVGSLLPEPSGELLPRIC